MTQPVSLGDAGRPPRDLDATLAGLLAVGRAAVGADAAAIYLDTPGHDQVHLAAADGYRPDVVGHRVKLGHGLIGLIVGEHRSVVSADVAMDPRAVPRRPDWDEAPRVRGFLGLPLRTGSFVIGALELTSHQADAFTPEDRGRASILADAVALLIEQTRMAVEPPPAALAGASLPEDVPLAIATLDQQMRVVSANPAFGHLVALPVEALIGRPAIAILPALGRPRARDALAASMHGAAGHLSGVETRTEGGRDAVLTLSIIPLGSPTRGVDGVMLAAQDVSERMRLEAERREQRDRALEAQARLSAVIEVVSHELRTPLTSVLGYARLLQDRPNAPDERRAHWASLVIDKARLMARLVDEVTELARLGSDRFTLHRVSADVGDLVTRVAAEIDGEAAGHDVVVAVQPGLPRLSIDADRIAQVLTNLLTNAVKYWPEGGTVAVTVSPDPGGLRVDVADAGPGVPPEEAERIFEPFYRIPDESTRAVPGTGLGLAVSRGIVEAHDGRLWVDPAPGGGAIFRFTLPMLVADEEGR